MFGWLSTWKIIACGVLQIDELNQAMQSINFPRLSTPAKFIGLITAKYLTMFQILNIFFGAHPTGSNLIYKKYRWTLPGAIPIHYLSTDMQTSTKLERYNPNVRRKDMRRHIKSPACQETVYAQPISNGIIMNVTSKSAIAKCVNIVSTLDGRLNLRWSNSTKTVIFPTDESTMRILPKKQL